MRSSTFSSLAVLASSLLVNEVAGRYDVRKRAIVTDEVIVTDVITVTQEPDGTLETGFPEAIASTTSQLAAVVVVSSTSTTSSSTSSSAAVVSTPTTLATSVAAATGTSVVENFAEQGHYSHSFGQSSAQTSAETTIIPTTTIPTTTAPATTVAPTTVATTEASSTTSAIATTSSVSTSGSKRGLAYNTGSLLDVFSGNSLFSFCYNWGNSNSGESCPDNIEFFPMLWGPDETASWTAAAKSAISSGSTHLMYYNEPDNSGQANVGYEDAAADYLTYMEPHAGDGIILHGPAVTNGVGTYDAPQGVDYLANFTSACSTCTINAISAHWYGTCDLATEGAGLLNLKTHIDQVYAAGGNLPVYLTEFQCTGGSDAETALFAAAAATYLDASEKVGGHSWFMAGNTAGDGSPLLFDEGSTSLNAVGLAYSTL